MYFRILIHKWQYRIWLTGFVHAVVIPFTRVDTMLSGSIHKKTASSKLDAVF